MSCKRKFRELKTADEEKALLEKSKINTIVTEWSCYKLFAHSALHSPGTKTKAASRHFKMNVY